MSKKIDGILCPARQARQERRTCDQLDERIGLADRLGGVQICRPLGGQTQTNREASKLWNEKADTQTSKQTGTMKDTQAERNIHPASYDGIALLCFSLCHQTHSLMHAHTCLQTHTHSQAIQCLPRHARLSAIRSQGEAACSFWVLTHRHAHTRKEKVRESTDICYWLEFRRIYFCHARPDFTYVIMMWLFIQCFSPIFHI